MTARAAAQRAGVTKRSASSKRTRAANPPIEYSLLLTATLCLLAFGAVMVFSASSTTSVLGESGDGAEYLKRTVLFGGLGLLAMKFLSVRGLTAARELTPALLIVSLLLLVVVLMPGVGLEANGARRWIGAGPIQVQPSELVKLSLILYGAHLIATRPTSAALWSRRSRWARSWSRAAPACDTWRWSAACWSSWPWSRSRSSRTVRTG